MAALVLAATALTGCRAESGPGERFAYQFAHPQATELGGWRVYPGSNPLPEQRELMISARRLLSPGVDGGRLLILDTDASLMNVVDYYATEYGIEIGSKYVPDESGESAPKAYLGGGDFASDEASLAPILDELNVEFNRGSVSGTYRSALIRVERGPTISLQRPYRDFIDDRVVDRTLIVIEE